MLRSVKKLFEDKLGASDGEIGHVNDFYFDDQNWAIRYLVADTGSWMPGRLVLISPHALGTLYQGGRILLVNLTRQEIENSPLIESHKPVSRQYARRSHPLGAAVELRCRLQPAQHGIQCRRMCGADELPAAAGRHQGRGQGADHRPCLRAAVVDPARPARPRRRRKRHRPWRNAWLPLSG